MTEPFSFDPLDPRTRRDPYALYARGRRELPVFPHPGLPMRVFSIFRHADCQAVLRDDAVWSNRLRDQTFDHPELAHLPPPTPSMLMTDGAEHARLRGLVNRAFTPRMVQRLEPRMRELARELVRAAAEAQEFDLVEALAYPLPVTIIAEMIGVPTGDRHRFKQWSDQAVELLGTGFFTGVDVDSILRQRELLDTMRDYFVPLAEERRRKPREDLLTGLVQARHEGSRLSHEEMLAMLVLILVAGNETTTNLIANAALALMEHPDQLTRLRAEPSLMSSAVEEVLRFSSPVQFDPRRATQPIELNDQKIEPGDVVLCWIGSANRDESVFDRAEVFDVARERGPHLAFGFGVHYCLGANLARLEAEVALAALLEATRGFERSDDAELPLHPSPVFRGVTRLPIRIDPA